LFTLRTPRRSLLLSLISTVQREANRRRLAFLFIPPARPRVPHLSVGRSGGGRVGEPRIFDLGVYIDVD
jgi:hypothetical protein